jgi:hypothetical protein
MSAIGQLLGEYDQYAEVFDPVVDREFLLTHLSDDLADIFSDLAVPLRWWDRGNDSARTQALWQWKFNITGHCGDHLVDALRPIHRLVFDHMNRDYHASVAGKLWCEAGTARLRPGSRAAYVVASVTASRRLQIASRGFATPRRQPPRRSGFGTRDRPCSLHQGR